MRMGLATRSAVGGTIWTDGTGSAARCTVTGMELVLMPRKSVAVTARVKLAAPEGNSGALAKGEIMGTSPGAELREASSDTRSGAPRWKRWWRSGSIQCARPSRDGRRELECVARANHRGCRHCYTWRRVLGEAGCFDGVIVLGSAQTPAMVQLAVGQIAFGTARMVAPVTGTTIAGGGGSSARSVVEPATCTAFG